MLALVFEVMHWIGLRLTCLGGVSRCRFMAFWHRCFIWILGCRRDPCWDQFCFFFTLQILSHWYRALVFQRHVFADDLQVYCHFLDGKEQVALQLFRDCSESVSRWMSSNRLKLNPLKTELIWLHSSRRNPTFLRKDIVLFGSPITPVNVVRNLGVILDENMTMSEHIARVCRNCYYQLRQIRRIKRSLTANSKTLLVLASVHSRLDYCNSVLYSLPWSRLQLLQSVLNLCSSSDSRSEAFWSHITGLDWSALVSLPTACQI